MLTSYKIKSSQHALNLKAYEAKHTMLYTQNTKIITCNCSNDKMQN